MKINIGPYISRWTTSSFEHWCLEKLHKKDYWEVKDSELTRLDHAIDKICDVWQTILNATINLYLDNKKRKIDVQIDSYDTWGMDHTLSLIILPMLKQLKETLHGAPSVDDKDVPKNLGLRSTEAPAKENEYDTDDNWHKRWDWVLDEMIWTFEQLADDDNEDQFHTGEIEFVSVPIDIDGNEVSKEDAKCFRMDRGPKDTHVFDKKGFDEHNKRIANGLRLFGRYFRGLWD